MSFDERIPCPNERSIVPDAVTRSKLTKIRYPRLTSFSRSNPRRRPHQPEEPASRVGDSWRIRRLRGISGRAVLREAREETSLEVTSVSQFHTYSDPRRDPGTTAFRRSLWQRPLEHLWRETMPSKSASSIVTTCPGDRFRPPLHPRGLFQLKEAERQGLRSRFNRKLKTESESNNQRNLFFGLVHYLCSMPMLHALCALRFLS